MSKVYLQEKLTAGDNITIDSTSKISADVPEISEATQSAAGLMPAADKKKLDGLTLSDELTETGANVVPANIIYKAIDKKQGKITVSTSEPTASDGSDGEIWMVYTPAPAVEIVSWANGTDEQIAALIAAADAGWIDLVEDAGWAVGDTRKVSLSAMAKSGTYDGVSWSVGETHAAQNVELVLMHQGGVKLADGNDCHFVVGMKDSLNESGYMNSSNFNSGSWDGCARRSWCNGAFRQAIPDSLRPIFKQMQTITAETYNGTTLKASTDYFALPAEREVFAAKEYSNSTEWASLVQFTWYATSANRIKKSGGDNAVWWERSPYATNAFCVVSNNGTGTSAFASYSRRLSPFGCI